MLGRTNNRRALGDIGNLVGALSTRCTVNKATLTTAAAGKNVGVSRNCVQVDRPVTRKLGATMERSQLLTQVEEVEEHEHMKWGAKQRRTMPSTTRKNNCVVPMEDCKVLESLPHHREIVTRSRAAMLKNEADLMIIDLTDENEDEDDDECCEMETEDEDPSMPDIDEADKGNPLAVADYVQDIYGFYRQREILSCVPADYMSDQSDVNQKMRAILIDWIIEVHLKFGLMHETLFLTVNLFDRYLSTQTVMRKSLQLVGITVLLLACKYEEIFVPLVEDFVIICDNAYTRAEILQMEKSILKSLQFNLTVPTPYVFITRFLKAAGSDKDLEMVSFFLMELCLVEYVMLKYPPSMLGAAAVYTGRCILRRAPSWNKTMEYHTTYTEDQLIECAKLMAGFHQTLRRGKLTSVHRKYSSPKFNCVSQLEPALYIGPNYL